MPFLLTVISVVDLRASVQLNERKGFLTAELEITQTGLLVAHYPAT